MAGEGVDRAGTGPPERDVRAPDIRGQRPKPILFQNRFPHMQFPHI